MCLLTFDITPKLRVRLLAQQLNRRLVAGHPTQHGDIAVESAELLLRKGHQKLERLVAGGGDSREISTLQEVLPEFARAFALVSPGRARTAPQRPNPDLRPAAAFDGAATLQAPDTLLPFTSLPTEGHHVTWKSTDNSGEYLLTAQLGEGGEGTVFEVDSHTVVKIFDTDHVTAHRRAKVELLVNSGFNVVGVCAPTALVLNEADEFVGYAMPRAAGRELQRTLFNRRKFEREFPSWKKADLVDICLSFLRKVEYLHSKNVLLGDINPKNVMVDENKHVSLIDADSWQINGYPCPVGTPMFTSPRMLGTAYSEDLRTPQDELYAVATMLFMIIMTGQFPYIRKGTDGNIVELIKEGNFAFQYGSRNNKDQPDGDWKYMWSHIHKPVKDLFWHTFHNEGQRHAQRPTVIEWIEAFQGYRRFLDDPRLNFDPMSNDLYPIRPRAFRPDTPILDCGECARKHAIAGIWDDSEREYHLPQQCLKCRDARRATIAQHPSSPVARTATPATAACKDCHATFPRAQMQHGRCSSCSAKATALDASRICSDCLWPFITNEHVAWFVSRGLNVPKTHAGAKKTCPPRRNYSSPPRPAGARVKAGPTPVKLGFWARLKNFFNN
nr:hypothetical protein [Microbacterium marinum]